MKKKIGIVIGVILLAALLLFSYQTWLAPKATQGAKAITLEVSIPRENIDKTFSYKTDHAFVGELLEEKKAELQVETKDSSFGAYITGMMGVAADEKSEFYNIKVNGEDAMVGISELPLEDGSTYTFTLIGF